MTVPIFLLIVALALSGYALIDGKFKGLLNWAVMLIAVSLLYSLLKAL
jgi:hypothetical protein